MVSPIRPGSNSLAESPVSEEIQQHQTRLRSIYLILSESRDLGGANRTHLKIEKNRIKKILSEANAEIPRVEVSNKKALPEEPKQLPINALKKDNLPSSNSLSEVLVTDEADSDEEFDNLFPGIKHSGGAVKNELKKEGYQNPLPFGPERLSPWVVATGVALAALGISTIAWYTYKGITGRKASNPVVIKNEGGAKKPDVSKKPSDPKKPDVPKKPEEPKKSDVPKKPDEPIKPSEPSKPEIVSTPAPVVKPLRTWHDRHSFFKAIEGYCKDLLSEVCSSEEYKSITHLLNNPKSTYHEHIKNLLINYKDRGLVWMLRHSKISKTEFIALMTTSHLQKWISGKFEFDPKNIDTLRAAGILPK